MCSGEYFHFKKEEFLKVPEMK